MQFWCALISHGLVALITAIFMWWFFFIAPNSKVSTTEPVKRTVSIAKTSEQSPNIAVNCINTDFPNIEPNENIALNKNEYQTFRPNINDSVINITSSLLKSSSIENQAQAIALLALTNSSKSSSILRSIAQDEKRNPDLRTLAISAVAEKWQDNFEAFQMLLNDKSEVVRASAVYAALNFSPEKIQETLNIVLANIQTEPNPRVVIGVMELLRSSSNVDFENYITTVNYSEQDNKNTIWKDYLCSLPQDLQYNAQINCK